MSGSESLVEQALRELDEALAGDDSEEQLRAAYTVVRAYEISSTRDKIDQRRLRNELKSDQDVDAAFSQRLTQFTGRAVGGNMSAMSLLLDLQRFFQEDLDAEMLRSRVQSYRKIEQDRADVREGTTGSRDGGVETQGGNITSNGGGPDLAIQRGRVNAETVHPDEEVPLDVEIANFGAGDAEDITLAFASDGPVNIRPPAINLESLEQLRTATGTVAFTATEVGTHTVTVELIRGGEVPADNRIITVDVNDPEQSVPTENSLDPIDVAPILAELGIAGAGVAKYHNDATDDTEDSNERDGGDESVATDGPEADGDTSSNQLSTNSEDDTPE